MLSKMVTFKHQISHFVTNTVKGLLGLPGNPGEKGNLGKTGPQVGYFKYKMDDIKSGINIIK